jgi:riboflavin synthase
MFTGIITDIGRIRALVPGGDTRLDIETSYPLGEIDLGASIACSGVCLTVVDKGDTWFAVQVSAETLSRSTLGAWQVGSRINLERALRLGDEMGGHIVSGHVDGIGRVLSRRPEGDSLRFVIEVPVALARFIAPKGSVAIDGVSLTVNEVEGATFGVNIIQHTQERTSFGTAAPGQAVNIEIDMLARYVARLAEAGTPMGNAPTSRTP